MAINTRMGAQAARHPVDPATAAAELEAVRRCTHAARVVRGARRARPRTPALPLLASLLLVTATGSAQITDTERVRVAERLREATVTVLAGRGSGSGFVVGPEGWVVTNAHVAAGARRGSRLRIRFADRGARSARLLAYDPRCDLALAKVDGEVPVRPLPLGDSDQVRVGQTVLAFGSPFGLDGTLTQGIVSAIRDLRAVGVGRLRGVIQTDAPINPGNSGGPLVNRAGQVVGVNTAILSRGGGSNGIGFAVPARYLKEMLAEVRRELGRAGAVAAGPTRQRTGGEAQAAARPRTGGEAQAAARSSTGGEAQAAARSSTGDAVEAAARASTGDGASGDARRAAEPAVWLGIVGEDYRRRGYTGVRVVDVVRGSPAARAGLLGARQRPPRFIRRLGVPWTGHILLAVDSNPVRSMAELTRILRDHEPGESALLTVTVGPGIVRGETLVKLAERP